MKTYREITQNITDKVYCDCCGSNTTISPMNSEYATLEALWGYYSSQDGKKFDIQLCENCFTEIIDLIKNKRRRYLGCFTYPYDKDPLNGIEVF